MIHLLLPYLPTNDEFSINCYYSDQTDTDDARATSNKLKTIQEYNIQWYLKTVGTL